MIEGLTVADCERVIEAVRPADRPAVSARLSPEREWQRLFKKCSIEIRRVLTDRSFDLLRTGSYVHENKFAKVLLWRCDNFAVRAHFWQKTETANDRGNIHDHSFSFASYVLTGSIENIHWRLSDSEGEPYNLHHYNPRIGRTKYEMAFIRTCNANIARTECLSAGAYYGWPSGELHETRVLSTPTVTVIVEQSQIGQSAPIRVLSHRYPDRDFTIGSPSIGESEMDQHLRLTLKYLQGK